MFDPASLKYDANGLIPAIAQDHLGGEVLMMAWMNADAVQKTLETGRVTYWSRSRQSFWTKGESSGHVQKLVEMRVDCDRTACFCWSSRPARPAIPTGEAAFYTALRDGEGSVIAGASGDRHPL